MKFFLKLLIFCSISLTINQAKSQTHQVTYLYGERDNGTLFSSGAQITNLLDRPDGNLQLLGFRHNGTVYSTGANDALLKNNNVSFVPTKFRALSVTDRELISVGLAGNTVIVPSNLDGTTDAIHPTLYPNNLGLTMPARLKTLLEDGKKGLNITTGYANIREEGYGPIEVPIDFNMSVTSIGDGIPDILISQIANPNTQADKLKFVDKDGNIVGAEISFNFTNEPIIASYQSDIFRSHFNEAFDVNMSRDIRLIARDLSDFGITAANVSSIKKMVYTLTGSSDPAFIAYNEDALPFLKAENDFYRVLKNSSGTTLSPTLNDNTLPEFDKLSVTTPPLNGSFTINEANKTINYIPNPGFLGTDTITYKLTRTINGVVLSEQIAKITIEVSEQTYPVTHFYGENEDGSIFSSGGVIADIAGRPKQNLHVLGFRHNNVVYSTGANDGLLSFNNVAHVPARFRALPVNDQVLLNTDANANLVILPSEADGSLSAIDPMTYPNIYNLTKPARLKSLLEDGKKGLNITTGYANIRGGVNVELPINFPMTASKIADGVPDILVSQIANPEGVLDKLKFVDVNGNTVGIEISFDFTKENEAPVLSTFQLDIFKPETYAVYAANTDRNMRLIARDFADFGITSTNIGSITKLVYTLSGHSDPAFIAYNEDAIPFLSVEDDFRRMVKNTTITIDPTINDTTLNPYDKVFYQNGPSHGVISTDANNANSVVYRPNRNFIGTDTITYIVERTINGVVTRSNVATITIEISEQAQNPVTLLYGERNDGTLFTSGAEITDITLRPKHNLHLVGFKHQNSVYSTGVNDQLLTQDNVPFIPSKFRALSVTDQVLEATDSRANLVLLPSNMDGSLEAINPLTYPNDLGLTAPVKLKTLLEDGKKGLNLTTGYANIRKSGGPIELPIDFDMNANSIADGVPDIVVSQIASPVSKLDKLKFVDASGNTVGIEISFDFTSPDQAPILATYQLDIFKPITLEPYETNTSRNIRLLVRDLVDFGITRDNIGTIKKLVYTLEGSSDPAFIAYNEESLPFLDLKSDLYVMPKNSVFTFNPTENDGIAEEYDVVEYKCPKNGKLYVNGIALFNNDCTKNAAATYNPNSILTYKPNISYTGTEIINYSVKRTVGSATTIEKSAVIFIKVLGNAYINPNLKQIPSTNP